MPEVTVHTEGDPSFLHACEEGPLCTLHHGFEKQGNQIIFGFKWIKKIYNNF